MQYKTYTGIALKRTAWREADEILTIWSVEEGKVRLLARGLKQQASKLRSGLSGLAWVEFSISSGRGFPVIIGVRTIRKYNKVASSLARLALAFNIFEFVLRTTADRQESGALSVLLQDALLQLDESLNINATNFLNAFLTKFMTVLGYGLILDRCASCGREIPPSKRNGFSHLACGLVCELCVRQALESVIVSPKTMLYILTLQSSKSFSHSTEIGDEAASAARTLLEKAMSFILERNIYSGQFLDSNLIKSS